jgi:hypothetical protein
MSDITPGAVLRQLQQAQVTMKKARQAIAQLRGAEPPTQAVERVLKLGWDSLTAAQRLLASIPLDAATDEVMTRQIALQRYATALLVRLRRVRRKDFRPASGDEGLDEEDS